MDAALMERRICGELLTNLTVRPTRWAANVALLWYLTLALALPSARRALASYKRLQTVNVL